MRVLLILLLALGLSACKALRPGAKDNVDPPRELVAFTPSLTVTRAWSQSVGKGERLLRADMGPSFGDGRIYAASPDGRLHAFDADSGRVVWSVRGDDRYSSTPGFGDGLVVVGTLDGAVVAYDASSGSERWRAAAPSEVIARPAIEDGVVVARIHDGRMFGLSARDGSRLWVYDRGVPTLTLRGNAPPLVRGGAVFAGYDDGRVVSLRLNDGAQRWEQTLSLREGRTDLERMADVDGDLQMVGSDVYAAAFGGQASALTSDAGRQLWVRDLSTPVGIGLAGRQVFAVDQSSVVFALDRASGSALWRQDALEFCQ
ncbi:MAG TPA: outer membrane protein assembly factor BamB, partial [Xanthomonadaceae bacterium]|nr:outer membrane protein assembly factor BamB [Xanthomonadaceae bacterium]